MGGWAAALAWTALLAAADGGAPPAAAKHSVPFAIVPGAPPGPSATGSYDLRPAEDGNLEYEDERISARVARDGQVTFKNRSTVSYRWMPFLPSAHPAGTETLQSSVLTLIAGRKEMRLPPEIPLPRQPASTDSDSSNDRRKRDLGYPRKVLPFVQIEMDLYEIYLGLMGEDPRRVDKARFMAATFERRMTMASRARAEDLRRAGAELVPHLEALWADPARPLVERKRLLCALWAEMDGDDPAARAHALGIERFAARKLPAASPERYSAAELAACTAGEQGRRFEPYAPAGNDRAP
jgi:hypothetical protein